MQLQLPVIGMLQGFADPPWQVRIRRGDHEAFRTAFNPHNSGQRVFSDLSGLRVLDDPSHLFLLAFIERPGDRDEALGIFVVRPMTGRAGR